MADILIERAKLAKQAEKYADMAEAMKGVTKLGDYRLTKEDRNLLSDAYNNIVGPKMTAWRGMSNIEERKEIESEIHEVCQDLLDLLDSYLVKPAANSDLSSSNAESRVFFLKMKGDYYKYLAEVAEPSERENVVKQANEAYKEASEVSREDLKPTDPIRLGLALNYSIYCFEIKGQPTEACRIAKSAFDNAIAELDSLPEDAFEDSTVIMQLLRDNLTMWTADQQDNDE